MRRIEQSEAEEQWMKEKQWLRAKQVYPLLSDEEIRTPQMAHILFIDVETYVSKRPMLALKWGMTHKKDSSQ